MIRDYCLHSVFISPPNFFSTFFEASDIVYKRMFISLYGGKKLLIMNRLCASNRWKPTNVLKVFEFSRWLSVIRWKNEAQSYRIFSIKMDVASPRVLLRLETLSHVHLSCGRRLSRAQFDVRKRKAKCATRNCHPSVTNIKPIQQLFISTFWCVCMYSVRHSHTQIAAEHEIYMLMCFAQSECRWFVLFYCITFTHL